MLSHKNWLIDVAVAVLEKDSSDRVAADAKLTLGRRLKISHPSVGYSQAEGLMLAAVEAAEIRALRRQARARDRSGSRRDTHAIFPGRSCKLSYIFRPRTVVRTTC